VGLWLRKSLLNVAEAVQIMNSGSDACAGFAEAEPQQKRALAAALMQNATWKAEKFESSWKAPVDKLAL